MIFKKLWMAFWTKNRVINRILEMDELLKINIQSITSNLECLDQNKVYVCLLKDCTAEELQMTKNLYKQAFKQFKWTPPQIMFVNKKITELTKKELKLLRE